MSNVEESKQDYKKTGANKKHKLDDTISQEQLIPVFRYRAKYEVTEDIIRFLEKTSRFVRLVSIRAEGITDGTEFEFESFKNLKELYKIIQAIPDANDMAESVDYKQRFKETQEAQEAAELQEDFADQERDLTTPENCTGYRFIRSESEFHPRN